ncbi:MAG: 16S rRNA (uracil(1498)-N(3))-methyltransferase [Candidatus Promineifilaceae bacterium]
MSHNRFFVQPEQISRGRVALEGDQARQIYNVLRLRQMERVTVFDGSGWEYTVLMDKVTTDQVTGTIESRQRPQVEPRTELVLYQSMLKKDNFEWILQKGTEIGVSRFVPFVSERSVVRQDALKPAKRKRWQRIIAEAAEQSGRSRLPELNTPLRFDEAVADANACQVALIPWVGEAKLGIVAALAPLREPERTLQVALFVGPEGGFTDGEIAGAREAGMRPVTLGPRVLRAETAAVVAAALALSAVGDL